MTDADRIAAYIACWKKLTSAWHCNSWTSIPEEIQSVLKFDTRLGMFNGMLVTKAGASGIEEFVKRMNSR